ncbi:MAG: hypothetical protein EOM20_12025 [Spartobacteria bacterium]|nr:hypothetical protein [Spartobacteria bacterium]
MKSAVMWWMVMMCACVAAGREGPPRVTRWMNPGGTPRAAHAVPASAGQASTGRCSSTTRNCCACRDIFKNIFATAKLAGCPSAQGRRSGPSVT